MPNATTKPIPVVYFHLDTPAKIVTAMEGMLAIGYQGNLVCEKDGEAAVWNLTISNPSIGVTIRAALGDVLVWEPESNHLDSMPVDAFTSQYTIS